MSRVTVTVDYGYDVHSVELTSVQWATIDSGAKLTVSGPGFNVEGDVEQDYWFFNAPTLGGIHVGTDDGRDIYSGKLTDAEVKVTRST